MLDIFKDYDITEVNPMLNISKNKSGTIGMSRIVDIALRNQKKDLPFQPFVILEDDVSFYREFPEYLEVPNDADLVHIGISKAAMGENRWCYNLYADDVNDDLIRVFNMLSSHGIMICTALGASTFQKCMMESFFTNVPWDIHASNMQPFYNVYALKKPLVYQDLEYGGQEGQTKCELTDYSIPLDDRVFNRNTISELMCYCK